LEHYGSDQAINEHDHVEHIHETEVLGQELNYDRPPNDDKDDVPEAVNNDLVCTCRMTHMKSYNYPTPFIPGDDDGAGSLADSKHDMQRDSKSVDDSSNQVIANKRSKPPKRLVSATPRTKILNVPRSGIYALNGGEGSGDKYDLRKLRASNATEEYDTPGRDSLRLAQRFTTSMLPTIRLLRPHPRATVQDVTAADM
jgi:hypothetical protein